MGSRRDSDIAAGHRGATIIPFRPRPPADPAGGLRDAELNLHWDRLLAATEEAWSRRDRESLLTLDDLVGWLLEQALRDWGR